MDPLCERIGYCFHDERLLARARTHGSYADERGLEPVESNQRLEFLGDAVIDLVVSDALCEAHPDWLEGRLTQARSSFVSAEALARVGAALGLGDTLLMGRGELLNGGPTRESSLADAVEALVGAIYLDGGLPPARAFVQDHILAGRERADVPHSLDPKTALQESVQAWGGPVPSYELLGSSGPSHAPTFVVAVQLAGQTVARGEGGSKRAAERAAASAALQRADLRSLIPDEAP